MRLTSPILRASEASIDSPVKRSSFAFVTPTIRGSRCVPPAPGMTPIRISGCPKIRALELIDALESFRRGPYTGALAAFSADGGADLNILIRSVLLVGDRATTWGGSGVTIDSDPEAERVETLHKIRGLAAALNWEPPT